MLLSLELLQDLAQSHGDQIAFEVDATPVTYNELLTAVNAIAVALQGHNPIAGSPVGLCAANSAEYLVSLLAILAAGKTCLPLNCHGSSEELYSILEKTMPSTIIVDNLGDELIHCDDDVKIHFSQFAGIVHTYRGQTPQPQAATES